MGSQLSIIHSSGLLRPGSDYPEDLAHMKCIFMHTGKNSLSLKKKPGIKTTTILQPNDSIHSINVMNTCYSEK